MFVLIGKGCTCSLFVCVFFPCQFLLLRSFCLGSLSLLPFPSSFSSSFLPFPLLPFHFLFPFLFPSVSLPFPFCFHSFSLLFPFLFPSSFSLPFPFRSATFLTRSLEMTMFNLPCQIAWLPRHHFPVLRGCSHSRGLLLEHSRG